MNISTDDPIYIVGHKNPDPDSICSAIAYSEFKKELGQNNYIPARCGNTTSRINSILSHFNVPLPLFLGDVTPRIHDIMVPFDHVQKITSSSTCAEALKLIDNFDIRALPVVDKNNHIEGVVSFFQLGEYFIPKSLSPGKMRFIRTSIEAIVRSLNADIHELHNESNIEDLCIRIGAMSTSSFDDLFQNETPPNQTIIVVGNRSDIQERAIDLGIRLLVITGKQPIESHILEKARKNKVSIIKSSHDIASTVWLIRSATPIASIVKKDVISFSPEEKLSHVRRKIAYNIAPLYFVVDDERKLTGVFSKSDIIKPVKTKLVLVDHNELTQAVNGADEVTITEIIDHHRLGNPMTKYPIRFINEPVGSTCTIIANMFRSHNFTPSASIAGLMMGGIITDTLNLNSPTTTDTDRRTLRWLSEIANITARDLSQIIFNSGSIILTTSPQKVIESDCKVYTEGEFHFSASQVEELGFNNFWEHYKELLEALETFRKKESLMFSLLLVTDINTQNSLLVVQGDHEIVTHIGYPQIDNLPIFELKDIVSRKKQLIPYITSLLVEGTPPPAPA
ncbi:MAG: pyrophosphatase [Verrucomicrobia bacterium]|nr:MAG: pyrophosphatase [Verrucomicrobiota bacterium]